MRSVPPPSSPSLRAALILLAMVSVALPALGATWTGGVDVQVNQDPPVLNQNETALALNWSLPGNLLMAYNDNPWPGGPGLGYSYSFDNGMTWTDGHLALPPGMVQYHDPMAAADLTGRFYAGGCANDNVVNGNSGLYVYSSTDGGATWSAPAVVSSDGPQPLPQPATLNDRGHLVVDTHAASPYANHVHLTWMKDVGSTGPFGDTWFSTSPPGGTSFSPRLQISDLPSGTSRSHAPHVASASDGTIYVVWADYDITVSQSPATFWLDRSYDGGANFGQDVQVLSGIATVPRVFSSFLGPDTQGDTAPVIATNPLQPNEVYVVYNADPDPVFTGDEGDIFFVRSLDGGTTWSLPIPVTQPPYNSGPQYAPWIGVKPNGVIDVAWYSGNLVDGPYPLDWGVLMSQSRDGGTTWTSPAPISDVWTRAPRNPFATTGWLGEYLALVVDSTWAYVGWAQARADSLGDIYYDRVNNIVFGDCDGNGIPDYQDLAACASDPRCLDCNGNQVLDGCDIDPGDPDGDGCVSLDADGDLIPDECTSSGVGEGGSGGIEFRARPNLTRGPARFHFGTVLRAGGTVTLFDATGRMVRVLAVAPGAASVAWDGTNAGGEIVAAGTYFARLVHEGGSARTRLIVAR